MRKVVRVRIEDDDTPIAQVYVQVNHIHHSLRFNLITQQFIDDLDSPSNQETLKNLVIEIIGKLML